MFGCTMCGLSVFVVWCLTPTFIMSLPTMIKDNKENIQTDKFLLDISYIASFDDISQFLKSWFRSFSERLHASQDKADLDFSRSKRDTVELKVNATSTNETSFEDYERMYLKNRTLNYIKQFYFYSKFRESSISNNSSTTSQTDSNAASINSPTALPNASTTTEEVRTDAVLEQLMEEVAEATLSELIEGLKDIKDVAERGLMDTDISSLCCPLG